MTKVFFPSHLFQAFSFIVFDLLFFNPSFILPHHKPNSKSKKEKKKKNIKNEQFKPSKMRVKLNQIKKQKQKTKNSTRRRKAKFERNPKISRAQENSCLF